MAIAADVAREAIQFVKSRLAGHDGSHDWWHVQRVRNLAMKLAQKQIKLQPIDLEVVELAAIFHDVADAKYSHGDENLARMIIQEFLSRHGLGEEKIARIVFIVENLSFRKELSLLDDIGSRSTVPNMIELDIVQDADRLDAIGAIGIARCFTYGGSRDRAIYNPNIPPQHSLSADEYRRVTLLNNNPQVENAMLPGSINHFYEKLLKLRDLMKTDAGKEIACERHAFLEEFLNRFFLEWEEANFQ
jgi:uncharacterized protein